MTNSESKRLGIIGYGKRRTNPITGVTGQLTLLSVLESIEKVIGKRTWIQFI